MELNGKIAVVTGGNRGIGFELCRQLLDGGATVVMTARDESKGIAAAEKLAPPAGRLVVYPLDVCDDQGPTALANVVAARFGRVDILINNAGVAQDKFVLSKDLDLDVLRHTLETNVLGVFKVTQALIPLLVASGQARIVNVSSQLGSLSVMGGMTLAYRMSKAALNTMTKVWASELADAKVLVNSVCPGWVRTALGGDGAPVTPAEGATAILALATIDNDGPTGTFVRDGAIHPW